MVAAAPSRVSRRATLRSSAAVDLLTAYANRTPVLEALEKTMSGVVSRRGDVRVQKDVVPRRPRLSEARVVELVEGYESGETVYALAERFGVDRRTVSEVLKREGVRLRYRAIEPAEHSEVIRLYESGLSLASVGEMFGVQAGTIRAILKQHGVVRRVVGTNQWG